MQIAGYVDTGAHRSWLHWLHETICGRIDLNKSSERLDNLDPDLAGTEYAVLDPLDSARRMDFPGAVRLHARPS